jgi:tetratricopeptide (TPR) repeat protein
VAADACRELGYIEFLRGQYERATTWVNRGMGHARAGSSQACALLTLQGSVYSDVSRYGPALASLEAAVAGAQSLADECQAAYALSMIGRVHLLRADLDRAVQALDRSIALARVGWTAFLPWPQALRAEIDLQRGATAAAADAFDAAFTLGCQFGDPCWEALAGRGRAQVAQQRGDVASATQLLGDALSRAAQLPDTYAWARAYVLDALCDLAVQHELPQAGKRVAELQRLASRSGMREMLVRAHLHAAAAGSAGAMESARLLAEEIDNPALQAMAAPGRVAHSA